MSQEKSNKKRKLKRDKRIPIVLIRKIEDEEGQEKEIYSLDFSEGYSIEIAGRLLGLHKNNYGQWNATDIKTGALVHYGEDTRMELLTWLLSHESELIEKFGKVKDRTGKNEALLSRLLEEYDDKGTDPADSGAK